MLTLEWLSAISWQTVDITLWQTVKRQRRFMDAAERRTEVTTVCVCKQSGETGDTVWQNWTGQFNTAYLPSWWLLQYASLPHLHTTTDWSRFSVKPLMGTLQLHSNGQLYSSTSDWYNGRWIDGWAFVQPTHQRPVYQLHIIWCGTIFTFALKRVH